MYWISKVRVKFRNKQYVSNVQGEQYLYDKWILQIHGTGTHTKQCDRWISLWKESAHSHLFET